jgi:hypothetical protein
LSDRYFGHRKPVVFAADPIRRRPPEEIEMSRIAQDLLELKRLTQGGAGALTQHLLREVAANLIAFGVADLRSGG